MRISDWSSDVCSSDLNKLDNVVFNQLGLWNTDNSHLVLVGDDSFAHPEAANGGDPDAFATTTIDSYGAQHGVDPLGLIMLDIEGAAFAALQGRSEERRVGKECVSPCRSRWARYQ